MKKVMLFIILLLFYPINIDAMGVDDFEYDGCGVYDFTDTLTVSEEDEINKLIDRFILLSDVDLMVVFISSDDYKIMASNVYELEDDGVFGRRQDDVYFVLYVLDEEELIVRSSYLGNSIDLIQFRAKYNTNNLWDGTKYSYDGLVNCLNSWVWYFFWHNFLIFIFIVILSLLLSKLVMFFIKRRYVIIPLNNADSYYDYDKYVCK